MTESEWLNATRLNTEHFRHPRELSERKRRLFTCACCRHVWEHFVDPRSRSAVEFVEDRVDRPLKGRRFRGKVGKASQQAHDEISIRLRSEGHSAEQSDRSYQQLFAAMIAEECVLGKSTDRARIIGDYTARILILNRKSTERTDLEIVLRESSLEVLQLFQDIEGNPFRPIEFDPRWRTSDVVGLARGIYEERAFERMPILADALMDAGCENSEIIAHCRGSGPHVRGCWLMDMILGKE